MTTCRNVDVSPQILDFHRTYGASDYTNPASLASNRSLNYAVGNTIQKAEEERISNIPRSIVYQDSVGLFGAENHFVKIKFALQNPISFDYVIDEYESARKSFERVVPGEEYTYRDGPYLPGQAIQDWDLDLTTVNTYEPAIESAENITQLASLFFKVELKNLKTGNKYVDAWLDVRLYNKFYEEHPYDIMYVKQHEVFYVGFHARNTRRLPYNVACNIAQETGEPNLPSFGTIGEFDSKYLSTRR